MILKLEGHPTNGERKDPYNNLLLDPKKTIKVL